jgi:carbamoyltransferase
VNKILGISAFYHDSSASILIDGKIISAAQEERFTRIKHDSNFPENAIKFVLKFSKLKLNEIDQIVFYEKPFLKFERLLETYVAFAPKGFVQFSKAIPVWIKEKLFQKKLLIDSLKKIDGEFIDKEKIFFSEHHMSHAASAFYPSPFEEAIVLTADGVGEWATTTAAVGKGNKLKIIKEIHFPHSIGLLYSAFTFFTGFKVNSGEYKLMGLAPYGKPKYTDKIKDNLIEIKEDGSFWLNKKYFDYSTGLKMTNKNFNNLFDSKPRNPEKDQITQFHMDLAASIQEVTNEVMIKICKNLRKEFNIPYLCLAGGVALNCVTNGKILEENIFKDIWIQPAAGDAGCSVGASLALWHNELKKERIPSNEDKMNGSYLGPNFNDKEIESQLTDSRAKFNKYNEEEIIKKTSDALSKGKAIGWFQGRSEFGPRALGARSILGDPRIENMQKNLNLKIKFRESFRPFAPSIIEEKVSDWFELKQKSPYMLIVSKILEGKKIKDLNINNVFGIDQLNIKRSSVPAITHVDYSARIQTVGKNTNPKFYKLLKNFEKKTNCPMLINTSFNVRGEPIVNSPLDAFNCFMGTNLDILVIENFYLVKENQDQSLLKSYLNKFKLD